MFLWLASILGQNFPTGWLRSQALLRNASLMNMKIRSCIQSRSWCSWWCHCKDLIVALVTAHHTGVLDHRTERILYLYTATRKLVLRHGPGHQARGQQSRATYKLCTFRHVIVTIDREVVDERKKGKSRKASSPIRVRRGAMETRYRHEVLYSYSHFSTAKYLTLPSPMSTPNSIIGTLGGFCCRLLSVEVGYLIVRS